MDYTQTIGNVNELRCMLAFIELGYDCSIPYGNSAKYDFIADINGELLKFQCKSATVVNEEDGTFMLLARLLIQKKRKNIDIIRVKSIISLHVFEITYTLFLQMNVVILKHYGYLLLKMVAKLGIKLTIIYWINIFPMEFSTQNQKKNI